MILWTILVYNDMSETFQCANLSDMLQIRSLFFISHNQKILYLSIGSFDLLISTFNIAALVTLTPLKEPPSDILIVLTLYSIIKTFLIYIAIIYDSSNPPSSLPPDFNSFCLATGFIEIGIRVGKGLYTIILTFLYANKVKNPLKAWIAPQREIHFLCAFLIILTSVILFFTNSIGVTIFGYCGVAYSLISVYILASVDVLYLVAFIGTTVIFLRNLRSVCNNNKAMSYFFNYYLFFLALISAGQLILTISEFIVAQTCREGTNSQLFSVSKILVNTSSCSLSVFVLVTILLNPHFRSALSLKMAGGFYNTYKKWIERQRQDRQVNQTFYDQLLTTNRNTLGVQLQNLANLDQGYLASLKDKSRACFLSSVLGCFALQHLQLKGYEISNGRFRTSAVEDDPNSLFSWNFYQKYTFILTNQIVQFYSHIFINKLPPVSIKFTSYSPNVLYAFQANNKLNISQSLSPSNNEKAIANDCGGGDGGSSGQFFFFNHDRTLILKTISSKQRVVFLQRLQHFHKHFKANPQSLIAKIYSIASVVNIDNEDSINFSLMSNIIGGIDKKYIVRSYDMKGSLHKREVLQKGEKVEEREHIGKTLKDVDFERLQQKVWVSSEDSAKLKNIIKIDSQFLCSHGLIDYSLLVIKLDAQEMSSSAADSNILKELSYYTSEKEKGMVYVVGIIDYLQTWNFRKKGEKWYKSLFTQKNTISSQNPSFYSSRFISFSQKILKTN